MFQKLAEQTLKLAARQKTACVGFLYMDLDGFKAINDHYSHQVGDAVLCEVADRLVQHLRNSDIICRYGGDEFVALISNPKSESDLLTISKKIIDEINKPITYQHHQLQVGISIGASCWVGGQSYNLEKLLAIADYAMYQAKQAGKNKVRLGKI